MGVPPTHKRVTAEGLTISRFSDGRIAEEWASWNKVAVLHRLGIFPIDQR
jgi:predicted ester cyclase